MTLKGLFFVSFAVVENGQSSIFGIDQIDR